MREKSFSEKLSGMEASNSMKKSPLPSIFYILLKAYNFKPKLFLLIVLVSVAAAITTLLLGKQSISTSIAIQNQTFSYHIWVLFGIVIFLSVTSFGRVYLAGKLAEEYCLSLKKQCWKRIIMQDSSFFKKVSSQSLYDNLTKDTQVVANFISTSLPVLIRNVILTVCALVFMGISDWHLTILAVTAYPAIMLPFLLWAKLNKKHYISTQKTLKNEQAYISDSINNIDTIQLFNQQNSELLRIESTYKSTVKVVLSSLKRSSFLSSGIILALFIATLALIFSGVWMTTNQLITINALMSFLLYSAIFCATLTSFSSLISDSKNARFSFANLRRLIKMTVPVKNSVTVKRSTHNKGILAVHHLNFAYQDDPTNLILKDISLTVSPGETLAIVGPSGAGKSTLLSVILGLNQASGGDIFLDGINYSKMSLESVREKISIVPQKPSIFSTTLLDNLLIASPDATLEDIYTVISNSQLTDLVEKLPDGIHTYLGHAGNRLSLGQQQRIAIARALLRNPEILLLDEATSSLDAQSSHLVKKALQTAMKNRTTIVIAHNLSTVMQADRIAVLNHGRIEVIGSHHELMQKDGIYQNFAKLQFQDLAA